MPPPTTAPSTGLSSRIAPRIAPPTAEPCGELQDVTDDGEPVRLLPGQMLFHRGYFDVRQSLPGAAKAAGSSRMGRRDETAESFASKS